MADALLMKRGEVLFLFSWPDKPKRVQPPNNRETDNSVLAKAMWLARRGKSDEADELIERWTSSRTVIDSRV